MRHVFWVKHYLIFRCLEINSVQVFYHNSALFSSISLIIIAYACIIYLFLYRCMLAFPEDYKTLVPKLLIETMASIGTSFVSCVNLATGDVVPETKAMAKGYSSKFFSCIQILFEHSDACFGC